jgi:Flp pilus assembly secretin CpaC
VILSSSKECDMAARRKAFEKLAALLMATIGVSPSPVIGQRLPGQENQPIPIPTSEREAHLQEAVLHLEAAGLQDEAKRIREKLPITNPTEARAIPTQDKSAESDTTLRQASQRHSQVIIRTQLIELSVSKMRKLGFNLATFSGRGKQLETPACKAYSIHMDANSVFHIQEVETPGSMQWFDLSKVPDSGMPAGVIQALRQHDLARVLAEPTLVTMDSRPATLAIEGKVPIRAHHGSDDNTQGEEVRIGTRLEVCPQLIDENRIRIELRLEWSGLDGNPAADKVAPPRLRRRSLDTGFETTLGHTMALAASPVGSGEPTQAEEFAMFVLVTADLVNRMPPANPTAKRGPVESSPTVH